METKIEIYGDCFAKDAADFRLVVDYFKGQPADVHALVNFEGVVTDRKITYNGRGVGLSAYFDVAGCASLDRLWFTLNNNHVLDFGADQFAHTKAVLGKHWVGSNRAFQVNEVPFVLAADELENCAPDQIDSHRFSPALLDVDLLGKIVIVHGGFEYSPDPSPYQRHLALRLADKKPKAIVFIHSHVVGQKEVRGGVPIYYGLGNFVFSRIAERHGFESCNSIALLFQGDSIQEFAVTIDQGEIRKHSVCIDATTYPSTHKAYKQFFKIRRPIDVSLRPRGLFKSYWVNKLQRRLYLILVTPIIRLRLQHVIKRAIKHLARI